MVIKSYFGSNFVQITEKSVMVGISVICILHVHTVLCFGLQSSRSLFNKFAEALQRDMRANGISDICHFLGHFYNVAFQSERMFGKFGQYSPDMPSAWRWGAVAKDCCTCHVCRSARNHRWHWTMRTPNIWGVTYGNITRAASMEEKVYMYQAEASLLNRQWPFYRS